MTLITPDGNLTFFAQVCLLCIGVLAVYGTILGLVLREAAKSRARKRQVPVAPEPPRQPGTVTMTGVRTGMGRVTINGQTFNVGDGEINIVARGSEIRINGQVAGSNYTGEVSLKVEGAVANIDAGGSVSCQNVNGDVDAGGSVQCGNVEGDVDAGGSVTCGSVNGSVDAGGSVNMRR